MKPLRSQFLGSAQASLICAVGGTIAALLLFSWDLTDTLVRGGLSALVWAPVIFVAERAWDLPRGDIPDAPADEPLPDGDGSSYDFRWVALVVPLLVAAAWVADRWFDGAVFVPGAFLGSALASLLAAGYVHVWERRDGRELLVDEQTEAISARRRQAGSLTSTSPSRTRVS